MQPKLYTNKFLRKEAILHGLTQTETSTFMLLYGERFSKGQVMEAHCLTEQKFQKRMSNIYQKFGLKGKTRGKFTELDSKLLRALSGDPTESSYQSGKSDLILDDIWQQLEPRIGKD